MRKILKLIVCIYHIISHAKTLNATAITAIKMIIEPNKTVTSFKKNSVVIFSSFIVLYTIAMEAANGNSHSIDCGVVPICSGALKLANKKTESADIKLSPHFLQ
ncbi:MAG: hypothetical protein ACYSQZ_04235 [Planctomycetota bacterium]